MQIEGMVETKMTKTSVPGGPPLLRFLKEQWFAASSCLVLDGIFFQWELSKENLVKSSNKRQYVFLRLCFSKGSLKIKKHENVQTFLSVLIKFQHWL